MRTNGIRGAKRRGKPWRTTVSDRKATRRPDLVQREFTASGPNELWCADFTYMRCWEGPVFFAFVIDVYSRMVVGWQFAEHMRTDLVLDALRMALHLRGPGADVELVHHSDAGSQYTSFDYSQLLDDHGVLASIGSVGDAYDNALAESFVDSFKTELIRDRVWRTRSQLELAIVEYVAWFNNERLHSSLAACPQPSTKPSTHDARVERTGIERKRGNQQNQSPWNPGGPIFAGLVCWAGRVGRVRRIGRRAGRGRCSRRACAATRTVRCRRSRRRSCRRAP